MNYDIQNKHFEYIHTRKASLIVENIEKYNTPWKAFSTPFSVLYMYEYSFCVKKKGRSFLYKDGHVHTMLACSQQLILQNLVSNLN